MTIRNRLSGQFSFIVASILVLFSLLIYTTAAQYRRDEFYERLRRKARTTARLLIEVKEVDRVLLKIIDRNTISALIDEKVLIFDMNNHLLYSSVDDHVIHFQPELIRLVHQQQEVESYNGNNELVGLLFQEKGQPVVVLASAYDQFGWSKLQNLGITLIWGLLGGLGLTVGLGFFYAGRALRPVAHINQQIQTITAQNLRHRLDEGQQQDEIDQLAANFNAVLNQLERAFEQQRSFVSHASHELRNPLAALKSGIQVGRNRLYSPTDYQAMLGNLESDTDRLIVLTNSLLLLARTREQVDQMAFEAVRLDEVVFAAQEELVSIQPTYRVDIRYDELPMEEADMVVRGSESLLRQVVLNLCDNACKYSADQRATIRITAERDGSRLTVSDAGIGIRAEEQERIFEPFYRAEGALTYKGFGIGLAICWQVVELHRGTLSVVSEPDQGSSFSVWLPRAEKI